VELCAAAEGSRIDDERKRRLDVSRGDQPEADVQSAGNSGKGQDIPPVSRGTRRLHQRSGSDYEALKWLDLHLEKMKVQR